MDSGLDSYCHPWPHHWVPPFFCAPQCLRRCCALKFSIEIWLQCHTSTVTVTSAFCRQWAEKALARKPVVSDSEEFQQSDWRSPMDLMADLFSKNIYIFKGNPTGFSAAAFRSNNFLAIHLQTTFGFLLGGPLYLKLLVPLCDRRGAVIVPRSVVQMHAHALTYCTILFFFLLSPLAVFCFSPYFCECIFLHCQHFAALLFAFCLSVALWRAAAALSFV